MFGVLRRSGFQFATGNGIELLDTQDRGVGAADLLAPLNEIPGDLAATQHQPPHPVGRLRPRIGQHRLPSALGERRGR